MMEMNDMGVTKPLRDEHRELLPRVESLRAAAEAAEGDSDTLLTMLDGALAFLHRHLIPHAQAEDAALYPKVEQVMRAPGATATMRRDHVEVVALTQELQRLRDSLSGQLVVDQRRALQRVLYGLYAVIRLHFAKEEEVYLPVLDAGLAPDEADAMFTAMREAAHSSGD
jgi:iron-sulfur cluster repair protein YtfE (RIC family)